MWLLQRSNRAVHALIVCTSYMHEEVRSELWAILVGKSLAVVPVTMDEVVSDGAESVTDGSLGLVPFPVHGLFCFLGISIWMTAVRVFCWKQGCARHVVGFGLLGSRQVGD